MLVYGERRGPSLDLASETIWRYLITQSAVIVHYLQLREHTGLDPDLGRAIAALAAAGLLPPDLRAAYDLLVRLQAGLYAPCGFGPRLPVCFGFPFGH